MRFWWARSCNAADKRGVGWRTSGDGRTASIRTRAIGALSTLVYISTSRHGQCGRASRNTDTEQRDTEIQLVVSPVSDQSVSPADLGVFVWSADSEDMVLAGPAKCRWRRLAGNEADAIGTVPVPWAGPFRCKNINAFFSDKIHGSNYIKRHSETVMVWNYQNYCIIYYNFCTLSFPMNVRIRWPVGLTANMRFSIIVL